MNRSLSIICLCLLTLPCFAIPAQAAPIDNTGPVKIDLQIPISSTSNTSAGSITLCEPNKATGDLDCNGIAIYIAMIYKWLVVAGSILAVLYIMFGGLQYLTAGGSGRGQQGQKMMTDALTGLALLLGSYVILYTINPNLVKPQTLNLSLIGHVKAELTKIELENPAQMSTDSGGDDGRICSTLAACQAICDAGEANWPKNSSKVIDPSLVQLIPSAPGLTNLNGCQATATMITALQNAARIAQSTKSSYSIKVYSAYRPLHDQIWIACDKSQGGIREDRIGPLVAWPGGSNHGSGVAADLQLWDGSTLMVGSSGATSQANSKIFDEIMTRAGFVRYSKEVWHYEYGSHSNCRCQYPGCPWPPRC